MLCSGSSLHCTYLRTFGLHEIFKFAHLKFTVYGRGQTDIHTTSANAVTLVWGSLRLAPIINKRVLTESACFKITNKSIMLLFVVLTGSTISRFMCATLRIKEVRGEFEIALFITNIFSVHNDNIQ